MGGDTDILESGVVDSSTYTNDLTQVSTASVPIIQIKLNSLH